jgi:hypothetical protein
MLPVRFQPTKSAGERPQTYDLDRAATETGGDFKLRENNFDKAELILLKIRPKELGYRCFSSHRVGNPGVFR